LVAITLSSSLLRGTLMCVCVSVCWSRD
jgi:hypothetical protein